VTETPCTTEEPGGRVDFIHANACIPEVTVGDRHSGDGRFVTVTIRWGTRHEICVFIDRFAIALNAAKFRGLADQLDALVAPKADELVPRPVVDLCAKSADPEGTEHGV